MGSNVSPEAKDLNALLACAEEAARQSGEFLAKARDSGTVATSEPERDVKLVADQESEARILHILRQHSDLSILSEEGGPAEERKAQQELRWIIDPLDGSVNYWKGIPFCCVSVGLWYDKTPVLGAVYDFNSEEMFTGIVGRGAWLNGRAIHVSDTSQLDRGILCTGFPVATDFSAEGLGHFVNQVRAYRKVRLLGTAALSLCYVATGRADAYYERDIKIWDVAAGLAIVRAAGGLYAVGPSRAENAITVEAVTPGLFGEIGVRP